jgi:diguanylate cyclase (GGDEF)-like protein/PAS domain S-box-containing protein
MDLAFEGNRDTIWDWDFIQNKLYISERWRDIVGFTNINVDDKIQEWKARVHPEDIHTLIRKIVENKQGLSDYLDDTHRVKHHDGHWIWIHMRDKCQFNKHGDAIRMTGTQSDVTQETNLRLKNRQLAQIIEQTNDSIISTDLDGYIASWNAGSENLFGYVYEEVIGKHISLLYPQDTANAFEEVIEELLQSGKYNSDVYFKDKYKKIIPASLSLSLLKDERGHALNMIGYINDISKRKEAEKELLIQKRTLRYQAHHDVLTGLPNRMSFSEKLEQCLKNADRSNTILALFFIDLDHFKEINDSLGHGVGDKVLKKVTKLLKEALRIGDTLSRLGGDEFTVIAQNLLNKEDASYLAEKILKILKEPLIIDEHVLYVSSSIGISLFPSDGEPTQDLLKYADAAMYRAKDEGRNNFQFYSAEMTQHALQRIVMESNLRKAISNQELVVYYQPQINGHSNTLIGMEALVRWKHPQQGFIFPDSFIPLAESTGIIIDIDYFVMKTAMQQFVKWYKEGMNPGRLALNLSVKQLKNSKFIEMLTRMLQETECKTEWIELEVTEGQIMSNPEEAIKVLRQISDMGIELAIDDFGTGYSSLAYLKKLPIDKLKIDRSFIIDLPNNEEDEGIAKAVIALAKSLNLKIIAEGVETVEQKDFLVQNGCVNIQGYFYSRPIPNDEMEHFLQQ